MKFLAEPNEFECFYTHAYLPNYDDNNKYFHMSK